MALPTNRGELAAPGVEHAALAHALDDATTSAQSTMPPSLHGPFSLEDGYEVQRIVNGLRLARGERAVGVKLASASGAVGSADSAICGRLTDAMILDDGGELDIAGLSRPAAVPHVALLLHKPLRGPVTLMEACKAVEAAAPAVEVVSSRYLPDAIVSTADFAADNAGVVAFAVGVWRRFDGDVGNLGLILSVNGRPVDHASTGAVLGHPLRALAVLTRWAVLQRETIAAGSVVLTGNAGPAQPLAANDHVALQIQYLGRAELCTCGRRP